MDEILHYLALKNQFYEKFHSMTAKFFEAASSNHWEDIEFFVENRERILNIIRSYDFKIAKIFQELTLTKFDLSYYRSPVKCLFDIRNEWVNKIVKLDLELITKLEETKSETIRELKKSLETSQRIDSFARSAPGVRAPKPSKDA